MCALPPQILVPATATFLKTFWFRDNMKFPKQVNRHCPRCNKHTVQKVIQSKSRGRNQSHPLSIGSKIRVRLRGQRRGVGNLGKYSKPPKPKMVGKKLSKKTDFRYQCSECKKMSVQRKGFRAKKIELV
jgi:ribosomal protein L44E